VLVLCHPVEDASVVIAQFVVTTAQRCSDVIDIQAIDLH